MEKEFTFTKASTGKTGDMLGKDGWEEKYTKKESDLTQQEKDLLLGNLIRDWENYPTQVQITFMHKLFQQTKDKMDEILDNDLFKEQRKKMFDELVVFGQTELRSPDERG